jgi:2'-5' RNA ligase
MFKPKRGLAREIGAFRHEQDLSGRYPIDRLHSTVQPVCDRREMAADGLERIRTLISQFRGEPVTIVSNRFNGNALRATATRAFERFRESLQRHLRAAGIAFPDYSSDPHISLAYGHPAGTSRAITPFVMRATHLLLIESIHGEGHVELGRWPLLPHQGELFH